MFSVGLFIGALSFLLPIIPAIVQPAPAEVVFAFSGFLGASNNIIPYSIVGEVAAKSDAGRFIGLLNTTQVLAQMLANFFASVVMQISGSVTYGIGE